MVLSTSRWRTRRDVVVMFVISFMIGVHHDDIYNNFTFANNHKKAKLSVPTSPPPLSYVSQVSSLSNILPRLALLLSVYINIRTT